MVMAEIQEQQNVPKLRFPEFSGVWEVFSLASIVEKHNSGIYKKKELYGRGINIIGVSNFFDIDAVDGQLFSRVPLSKQEVDRYTLKEGDIIYTESSLVRSGIAKSLYVTAKGEGTAFAWHTRRFSVNRKRSHPAFLYYYLASDTARRFIVSVVTCH